MCSSCLCFYSNWLGNETKKVLPYSHISKLCKRKVAFLNPALEVSITYKRVSKTYTFTSFFPGSRDSCFKLCQQLYMKTIQAEGGRVVNKSQDVKSQFSSQPGQKPTQAETNARVRRSNTEVPQNSSRSLDLDDANSESVEPALVSSPAAKENGTPGHVVESNDSQEGMYMLPVFLSSHPLGSMPYFFSCRSDDTIKYCELPPLEDKIWDEFKDMDLLVDEEVPISVEDFYNEFLSDFAKYTESDYLHWRGDSEISVSEWNELPSREGQGQSGIARTVRVRQKLSAMMGPSSTRVEKSVRLKQHLARPDDKAVKDGHVQPGLCLVQDTSARSFDVPYGDSFTNEDRWIISKCDGDETGSYVASVNGHEPTDTPKPRCRIQIRAKVQFTKSTFLAGTIRSKSKEGMMEFYKKQIEQMREHLESRPKDSLAESDSSWVSVIENAMQKAQRDISKLLEAEGSKSSELYILSGAMFGLDTPRELADKTDKTEYLLTEYAKLYTIQQQLCKNVSEMHRTKSSGGILNFFKDLSNPVATALIGFVLILISLGIWFFFNEIPEIQEYLFMGSMTSSLSAEELRYVVREEIGEALREYS